jgi:hypothetical protein
MKSNQTLPLKLSLKIARQTFIDELLVWAEGILSSWNQRQELLETQKQAVVICWLWRSKSSFVFSLPEISGLVKKNHFSTSPASYCKQFNILVF